MQLLALVHLLVIVEANWRRPGNKSRLQKLSHPAQEHSNPYDIYEQPIPVDFTNLGKVGILDPSSGLKQPFDGLAMYLRYPNSPEEEEKLLRTTDPRNIIKIANRPKYSAPRIDPYAISVREYNPDLDDGKTQDMFKTVADVKMPLPFDFEKAQAINIALPYVYRDNIAKAQAMFRSGPPPDDQNGPGYDGNGTNPNSTVDFYPPDSYDLNYEFGKHRHRDNWTTCDEFVVNARFHPREVAGVEWVIFYVWGQNEFPRARDIKFSYPTKQLVHEYKTEYGPYVDERIDWKQPMLLLNTWMEILLVAGDRRGLFYGIPKHTIPEEAKKPTLKVPIITIRMKMVNQYLAVMLCEERMALMLATVEEVPNVKNMEREAAKLGFRGKGKIFVKTKDDEVMLSKKSSAEYDNNDLLFYESPKAHKTPFFNDDPFVT